MQFTNDLLFQAPEEDCVSFSLGADFNSETITLSFKLFLRRGLLYDSYIQEVIVKIVGLSF